MAGKIKIKQKGTSCEVPFALVSRVLAFKTERLTVGAFNFGWVGFVSTYGNFIECAVVFTAAVMCTLLNCTANGTICFGIHEKYLPYFKISEDKMQCIVLELSYKYDTSRTAAFHRRNNILNSFSNNKPCNKFKFLQNEPWVESVSTKFIQKTGAEVIARFPHLFF